MSIAVSEILKQVDLLPVDEQTELTARLIARAERSAGLTTKNGHQSGNDDGALLQDNVEMESLEDDEVEEGLDVFSLNHVPPKRTYMAYAQFYYAGRGEPQPYDFDGLFDDEDENEAEPQ